MLFNSLVFEGGGVKGISYIGAIEYLEDNNILKDIINFGGSSAGSHIATLLAIGYKSKELKDIFFDLPLNSFKSSKFGCIRDIICFFKKYGYYDGKKLEKYFDDMIANKLGKKGATFIDAFRITKKNLKITGTCLETREIVIFDHINYPNMKISKAIHISSAIPFFFMPVKFMKCNFVDGGCLRNFPIKMFSNENDRTLGIELICTSEINDQKITNIKGFTFAIVNTLLRGANRHEIIPDNVKIITINVEETSAINFDLNIEEKNYLINKGYLALKENLKI